MHLLCKHAAVTREDGWKEELVTHSGAIQLHSLSLSGVVIDGSAGRSDGRGDFPRPAAAPSDRRRAPWEGILEKGEGGREGRICHARREESGRGPDPDP